MPILHETILQNDFLLLIPGTDATYKLSEIARPIARGLSRRDHEAKVTNKREKGVTAGREVMKMEVSFINKKEKQ